MPPVNSAEMETPVTAPMVMSTREGGMVSVCAPVAGSRAMRSPGLAPRSRILGNSTGARAAMSVALDPEMPDTKYVAATSTLGQPAPHVAEQAGQEGDHGPHGSGDRDHVGGRPARARRCRNGTLRFRVNRDGLERVPQPDPERIRVTSPLAAGC